MDRNEWIVPAVALAAIVAAVGAWALIPSRRRVRRIALVGDSLAVGLSAPLKAIAERHGIELLTDATVGTTPKQWADHASACGKCGDGLADFDPDLVLVSLGTNDLGYYPDPPAAPYFALSHQFAGGGASVVWIQPPAMPTKRLDGVRKAIRSLALPEIPPATVPLRADGVHPVEYSAWAEFVWNHLRL